MFLRLAFALQAHIDASIIIIDEALTVGDVFFRQKCYARLEQLKEAGAAILLVSHSMPDIEQYCERAILLDHGELRFIGPSPEASKRYYLLHQGACSNAERRESTSAYTPVETQAGKLIDRPPAEAFLDLTDKPQISNGQARCVGVALCNAAGEPCNSFQQGDRAIFYSEFELKDDIGIPIGGLVLKNERSIIVHGKNGWQYNNDIPISLGVGSKVLCKQEINLDLGPGEYVFEIGLASVSKSQWENRAHISHEEMSSSYINVCQVPNVGSFSIGLVIKNGVSILTHHGITDLPGEMQVAVYRNQRLNKEAKNQS